MNIHQINQTISSIETARSGSVAGPRAGGRNEKLKKACQDFESLFLYNLMKNMRESVPQSGLLGEGLGGEYFRSLFDEAVARAASKGRGMGLSEMLYRNLSQGKNDNPLRITDCGLRISPRPPQSEIRNPKSEMLDRVMQFNPIIQAAAERYALNPHLIQAVIAQESGGNPDAVSPKGAKGLMQLMEETAGELGLSEVTNPRENIFGGARHLRRLLDRFGEDVRLALAAYNAGMGAVERYGRIPPYRETREFVERVMHYFGIFAKSIEP